MKLIFALTAILISCLILGASCGPARKVSQLKITRCWCDGSRNTKCEYRQIGYGYVSTRWSGRGVSHTCITHYDTMPIQYTVIFLGCKKWLCSDEILLYFFSYFCSKHRLWVHVRIALQFMFLDKKKKKKIMYTPVHPSYTYII